MTTPLGAIPASSITAARAWILARLQAVLTPDPASPSSELLVCDGGPGPYQPDDIVSLGDTHQTYAPESGVGSGGAGWLREDYQLHITVDVYRGGDNPDATFARARTLADLVVAVVRSDPSLGGAVDRARPATAAHSTGWDEAHSGRHVEIDLTVDCLKTI
ncbi:hypothetical protein CFP65_3293 [Kitasatospora sp. MMS16-BH015]|uniref:hypothetical protein n=1 Tax=Kitasatospora sp. MMS16-BH015 TaxID=2018025 RepID=UPI000CA0C52D|nr:hypothetical protein [Kitasatospora sp. MMS16-BH015]AUG78093.1 hypothetical protein CFP65_3293 [Kitasatospora sp. MMS16-BH015]